jgi:hypothetical protein
VDNPALNGRMIDRDAPLDHFLSKFTGPKLSSKGR